MKKAVQFWKRVGDRCPSGSMDSGFSITNVNNLYARHIGKRKYIYSGNRKALFIIIKSLGAIFDNTIN